MPEGYIPEVGIKYQQVRDLSLPTVRIDVVKGIDNVRNITLSQIAKDIIYINIGKQRLGTYGLNTQLTPHGILVNNLDGVWLYNFDGQIIKEIYKNHLSMEEGGGVFSIGNSMETLISFSKFTGIEQVIYSEKDDRIWVKFKEDDYIKNYSGFMGYIDLKNQLNQLNVSVNEMEQFPVVPLGKFTKGSLGYAEDFVLHRPHNVFGDNNTLTTHTFRGDTLSRLTFGFDSITNAVMYSAEGKDGGHQYYYRNILTFRPTYSDTLFRIIAANVVKPVYILDMGTSGRATNQGKPSDVNLDLMYRFLSLHEDDRYLYLRFFTGRVREQTVWWGLYDKNTREFYTVPVVGEGSIWGNKKGLKNDIDGGLPFWPQEIGKQGEKYMYVSGESIKKLIPEKPSEKLKQFMLSVDDDDLVIIIVK